MSTSFHAYTEAQVRAQDIERRTRTPQRTVPGPRRRHALAVRMRRLADAIDN